MEAQTHRTESVSSEPNSRPHHRGLVRLVGVAAKRVAPILSSVVRLWPDGAAYAAMYTEVLLGKGAGAGWDLQSETKRCTSISSIKATDCVRSGGTPRELVSGDTGSTP